MRALLETTAISDILAREPNTIARVNAISPTALVRASVVSYGEVEFGLEIMPAGRRRRGHQQQAQALFASLALENVTPAVADTYVQIKADLQRKGEMIPEADLWIAATARAGGYLLVTRDDHFSRVEGLQTADWSK